ncbi:hypothetical protein P280DRAFT_171920 [Massarina eburnea CBS 473.64]|uniref:Uncharacterized protein n=1 Tax=Massarina eburnea CBS 473.64 TaxID=1395130 RepID=A0A6A6S9B2_9PLEO|nr:hypothetical protein P280DRAFT_171920 [Massarina eburnea CBS 473.64]
MQAAIFNFVQRSRSGTRRRIRRFRLARQPVRQRSPSRSQRALKMEPPRTGSQPADVTVGETSDQKPSATALSSKTRTAASPPGVDVPLLLSP